MDQIHHDKRFDFWHKQWIQQESIAGVKSATWGELSPQKKSVSGRARIGRILDKINE
jgi:hypothetical protein